MVDANKDEKSLKCHDRLSPPTHHERLHHTTRGLAKLREGNKVEAQKDSNAYLKNRADAKVELEHVEGQGAASSTL